MANLRPSKNIYGVVKAPYIKPANIDEKTGEVKREAEYHCQFEVETEQDDDTASFELVNVKIKNKDHWDFLKQVTGKTVFLPVSTYSFKAENSNQVISGFSLSKTASIFEIKHIEIGASFSSSRKDNLALPKAPPLVPPPATPSPIPPAKS